MKTTDISMRINIHLKSKRKSYILRNLWFFLIWNINFQRSRGGFIFFEKYHNFTYVSLRMYLMQYVARIVVKLFIAIKIKIMLLDGIDKM